MVGIGSFQLGMSLPSGINMAFVLIGFMIAVVGGMMMLVAIRKRKEDMFMYMLDQAKAEDKPFIVPLDMSFHGQVYLGTYDDPSDIRFKDIPFGLQVRPAWLEKAFPITLLGVRWYFYFGNMYFPSNLRDAFTLALLRDAFRKDYPRANFISDDMEIITMMCLDSAEDLRYNCGLVIREFEQDDYAKDDEGNYLYEYDEEEEYVYDDETGEIKLDDDGNEIVNTIQVPRKNAKGNLIYMKNENKVTEDELYDIIKQAKETILKKRMRTGFINIKEAIALIPFSMDGLVMDRIVKITTQKTEAKMADEQHKDMRVVWIIALIFATIIGGYLIKMWWGTGGGA